MKKIFLIFTVLSYFSLSYSQIVVNKENSIYLEIAKKFQLKFYENYETIKSEVTKKYSVDKLSFDKNIFIYETDYIYAYYFENGLCTKFFMYEANNSLNSFLNYFNTKEEIIYNETKWYIKNCFQYNGIYYGLVISYFPTEDESPNMITFVLFDETN
jgi:hypothetical protein